MAQIQRILIFILLTAFYNSVIAQNTRELSVYAGGGLSSLKYDLNLGKHNNGFGGMMGARYSFFFGQIGISSGLELSLHNAKTKLDNLSTSYLTQDFEGTTFEFRTSLNNYAETQSAMFVNIPVMFHFNFNKFYISAGGKIGFPVSGKYKSSGTLKNSGYFPLEDYEYTEQDFLGFGTFNVAGDKKDLNFEMAYMLSAEAGIKWQFNKTTIYTGVYVDYGLNNILKDKFEKNLIEYNASNPKDIKINSVMQSQYLVDSKMQTIASNVSPMAIGIKIQISLFSGTRDPTKVVRMRQPIFNGINQK